jgi:NAD(P)-dependent dehydrogenase (short-subunit alcohol dehydrogenase family)
MAFKSLSIDVQPRGIIAAVFCPGWVQTDMGGANASLTPQQSVSGVKKLLDSLRPEDSGKFFYYNGDETPW